MIDSFFLLFLQLFLTLSLYSWAWIPMLILFLWNRRRKKLKLKELEAKSNGLNKLTIGKNQKFLKAHFIPKGSKFTSAGFDSEFKVYFSKETFCFKASGFAFEKDGVLFPKITNSWCESHNRMLTDDEINTFFGYIINHDADFLKKLELCKP